MFDTDLDQGRKSKLLSNDPVLTPVNSEIEEEEGDEVKVTESKCIYPDIFKTVDLLSNYLT